VNIILVIFDSLRKDCVGAYGSPPWGAVQTPRFDAFAGESLVMTRAYPESLPTLPARRAIYTGRRVYPFHDADFRLKGDFVGAPGWGPIPEDQPTLAERLREAGYRTGLVSDVYHMFKPSKNFWRGFHQWNFLRGQEMDPARSGPRLTEEELDAWIPPGPRHEQLVEFMQQCVMNVSERRSEEDFFAPRVLREAALWLEQNRDAERRFLTVESFDPHEPWLIPAHYRRLYLQRDGREQVRSGYADTDAMEPALLERTQANYSGAVTLCDRWFGHFVESLRVLGLLENTLVIVTSDHGHSIGDRRYLGKRGYPSAPEVYDIPLMLRFPNGEHGGRRCDLLVQHHDITATILHAAGLAMPPELDGFPFVDAALGRENWPREHVTGAWGSAVTVVDERWWLNAKVDGTGVLLHDLAAQQPFRENVARDQPRIVERLFGRAVEDAGGSFPEWILEMARNQADAPGCSDLAARA
jgi:arylsulfatase A-like enzyme